MLLREFWNDRFWPHCTRNLRESTRVGYESAWRLHVMPCFGGMGMDAISVELVDKWLANFDTAGAARKAWAVIARDTQAGYPLEPAGRGHHQTRHPTAGQTSLRAANIDHPSAARTVDRAFYGHPLEAWAYLRRLMRTPHRRGLRA